MRRIEGGAPYPFGATVTQRGTNFALFSDNAEGMELCLFDSSGSIEQERVSVTECTDGVWHCHLPGIGRGQVYGWRVHGPWAPEAGHRFNPAKLLLDPYARKLVGEINWDDALHGYAVGAGEDADLTMDERDSAPFMVKARVITSLPLTATTAPRNFWPRTVIYEGHVRGLTMRHPLIPEEARGTFAALGSVPMVEHLQRLGVTALELLPVQAFTQDRNLVEKGLANYWGYNTLNFFAPEPRYLGNGGLDEIGAAVDRLHQAGIEVILDVVYNHTCEGNHLGPTLSWRGIDNASYYHLMPGEPRFYDNLTGTGNALNTTHPRVMQMVMDSLRLWATIYGIDGFRFDLATTLGRRADGFDPGHPLLLAMRQDPVVGRCKLIMEPWDVGPGGYQLGNFPAGFSEWNGDYRDVVRDFWVGSDGLLPSFASRFAASSDLFGDARRRPWSSVNFITAHDGFTLQDLVSYDHKHNEANGEDNRDGHDDNKSWNCGIEGETDDPEILERRARQKRNLLATLFLSQGVPMMLAGDEMSNSQGGNNNAYCQDNEIGWLDWDHEDEALTAFVARLAELRKKRSALSRPAFLTGVRNERGVPDVAWFAVDGSRMTEEEWNKPHAKCLVVRLAPAQPKDVSLLIMLNAAHHGVDFTIPPGGSGKWEAVLDTAGQLEGERRATGETVIAEGRSLIVWEARA